MNLKIFLVYTIRKQVLASAGRVDNFSSYKKASQPETRPICTYLFRVHNRIRTLQEVKFKLVIPEGRFGNRAVTGTGTTRNLDHFNDDKQIYYQELGGEVAQLCVDDGSMFRAVVV